MTNNEINDAVASAIRVMLAQPEADQTTMVAAIASQGIAPRQAWRLYQFLPIAFFHVIMRGKGVVFEPNYISLNAMSGARTQYRFVDEPLYIAGVKAAEQMVAEGRLVQNLFPVFGRSAEYHTLMQILPSAGNPRGGHFVEPILFEYEE